MVGCLPVFLYSPYSCRESTGSTQTPSPSHLLMITPSCCKPEWTSCRGVMWVHVTVDSCCSESIYQLYTFFLWNSKYLYFVAFLQKRSAGGPSKILPSSWYPRVHPSQMQCLQRQQGNFCHCRQWKLFCWKISKPNSLSFSTQLYFFAIFCHCRTTISLPGRSWSLKVMTSNPTPSLLLPLKQQGMLSAM